MKKLLKIAFNLPLYGTYDYIAPEGTNNIKIGMRVETYFGRKRLKMLKLTFPKKIILQLNTLLYSPLL